MKSFHKVKTNSCVGEREIFFFFFCLKFSLWLKTREIPKNVNMLEQDMSDMIMFSHLFVFVVLTDIKPQLLFYLNRGRQQIFEQQPWFVMVKDNLKSLIQLIWAECEHIKEGKKKSIQKTVIDSRKMEIISWSWWLIMRLFQIQSEQTVTIKLLQTSCAAQSKYWKDQYLLPYLFRPAHNVLLALLHVEKCCCCMHSWLFISHIKRTCHFKATKITIGMRYLLLRQ